MKIFTAGLLTETCDLTPIPTTEQDWTIERYSDNNSEQSLYAQVLTLFRTLAEDKGWEVAESLCATAFPPGGRTVQAVYENLRTMILKDLRQAMPVDGVLLNLHGAAMAHGYDDIEGDLLEHIRAITGPDIPIGVELDPHCHLTEQMMTHGTFFILYKTFYHTDIKDRAKELFQLLADTLEKKIKPTMALFDCKMIDFFDEATEPMGAFLTEVYQRETEPGVLSISPVHGFPFANIDTMGSQMLVITDDNPALAKRMAEELGQGFFETRGQMSQYGTVDDALGQAQTRADKGDMRICMLDFGDTSGCGYPTDGTELLRTMQTRGMTNTAVGLMWDPLAVSICHDVGPGAELTLRIGGKASVLSGAPLDLAVVIERIDKDITISTRIGGDMFIGDVAVVKAGDTHLILVSQRAAGYGLQVFEDFGIDTQQKQYIVFKHIDANYDGTIFVYGPTFDYKQWPLDQISRPKWPWDEDPFV